MTSETVSAVSGRPRPWVHPKAPRSSNARRNQEAWDRMSICERELGIPMEQVIQFHRSQRAGVLARMGMVG